MAAMLALYLTPAELEADDGLTRRCAKPARAP